MIRLPRSIERGLIEAPHLSAFPSRPTCDFRVQSSAASLKRDGGLSCWCLGCDFRVQSSAAHEAESALPCCNGVVILPRSIERGLIEAWITLVVTSPKRVLPRSIERGLTEATEQHAATTGLRDFRVQSSAANGIFGWLGDGSWQSLPPPIRGRWWAVCIARSITLRVKYFCDHDAQLAWY